MVRLTLPFLAPIPVGNHITALPLETRVLLDFGGDNWIPSRSMIVCDDDTRVVYTTRGIGSDAMTYESITLDGGSIRIAQTPPLRGRVRGCVVRSDSGERIQMETVLVVEPDPVGYR